MKEKPDALTPRASSLVDELLKRIEDGTNHLSLGECRSVMAALVSDIGLMIVAIDAGEVD